MDGRIMRVHISRAQIARPHCAAHPPILSVFVPACITKDGTVAMSLVCGMSGRPMGSRIVDGLGCILCPPISRKMWTAKGAADIGRPPNRAWKQDVANHWALIGRPTWTGVVARRGQEWAAVVGLSGRPHWTNVVARIGRDWLPMLGEYGRPNGAALGGHLYAIWAATWSGGGRRWTHVKLGGHMRVMTLVHARGV